ncbi:MAG: peroxiredoxin family protein [Gemmatimonadota bacterium]
MSKHRRARLLPHVALAVAAVLVVLLARRDLVRQREYTRLLRRAMNPHPGLFVPTFTARTLEGDTITLGHPGPGRAQLLFFFTTTCPYCRASIPAVRRIAAAQVRGRVVAISLDSLLATRAYAREHALHYPVVPLPERKLADLYRVRRVPLVLVIGEGDEVVYARAGILEGPEAVDSVLEALRNAVDDGPLRATGDAGAARR